jgi:hypothetical protein
MVRAEERQRKAKQARKAKKMVIPAGSARSAVPTASVASASRRQIRSRTLALARDTRTMRFHANHVSTSVSGDYYQVMFEAEDTNDPDSPYLLIQRQFETSDGGRCYIETHDEKYIGHFLLRRAEFTPERLSIEFDRPSNNLVSVTFSMAVSDFEQASPSMMRCLWIKSFSFSKIAERRATQTIWKFTRNHCHFANCLA